jgi:tetratricopeptide (TPR) repeat protein
MDYSISEMHRFDCHRCGAPFDFQVWFVVDIAERPDLVAQIKTGSLHRAACPRCDEVFPLEVSLLLYRHEVVPRLLFSPKPGETVPDIVPKYCVALKDRMGAAWRDEWLSHVGQVARENLVRNIEFDTSTDPEANRLADLDLALQRLDRARSAETILQVVEAHPCLLSEEAEQALQTIIASAKQGGDTQNAAAAERVKYICQVCRVIDPKTAIRELAESGRSPTFERRVNETTTLLSQLDSAFKKGDPRAAEHILRQLRELSEQAPHNYMLEDMVGAASAQLVVTLAMQGNGPEAERIYRGMAAMVAAHPQRKKLREAQAAAIARVVGAYGKMEDLPKALEFYDQLVELAAGSDLSQVRTELAQVSLPLSMQLAHHDQAEKWAEVATEVAFLSHRYAGEHGLEGHFNQIMLRPKSTSPSIRNSWSGAISSGGRSNAVSLKMQRSSLHLSRCWRASRSNQRAQS